MKQEKFEKALEIDRDIRNANDYLNNINYLFERKDIGVPFRVSETCNGQGVKIDVRDL